MTEHLHARRAFHAFDLPPAMDAGLAGSGSPAIKRRTGRAAPAQYLMRGDQRADALVVQQAADKACRHRPGGSGIGFS